MLSGSRNIVNYDYQQNHSRKRFLFLQGIHILVFFIFLGPVSSLALFVSGLVCILFYGLLIRTEIILAPSVLSPFVCYLAAGLIRLGLATCWAAVVYHMDYIEAFQYGIFNPSPYLMYGHVILLIGDWFFIAGYSFWARIKGGYYQHEKPPAMPTAQKLIRLGIGLITFGWLVRIAFMVGIPLQKIGNLWSYFISYASPAGLLLLLNALRHSPRPKRPIVGILIVTFLFGELTISLQSYMKQSTVVLLMPLIIYFASSPGHDFRKVIATLSKKRLIATTGILLFIVLILFPYSEMRRPAYRVTGGNVGVLPFLFESMKAAIPGTDEFNKVHVFPEQGLWHFFSRHASIVGSSWSYSYVTHNGVVHGELLKYGVVSLIPRLFWPAKPLIDPGRKIAVMLGQAESFETASTSTGAGDLAGGLYLNWGAPCLAVGLFLNGIMLCLSWRVFQPYLFTHPIATVVMMILFVGAARHFESGTSGWLPGYTYIFVVFYPPFLLTRRFFSARSKA